MGTVISELFDESGMSVQAFADKAGLKYGTAYDIAKGVSKVENIGAGAFVRIAHVFGKTADELLSDIPAEPFFDLSPDEKKLLDAYRKCSEGNRSTIRSLALSLSYLPDEAEYYHQEELREYEQMTGGKWEDHDPLEGFDPSSEDNLPV